MKTFKCNCPGEPSLFFESNGCTACGRVVGLTDDFDAVHPFDTEANSGLFTLASGDGRRYKKCKNFAEHQACNGMVEVNPENPQAQTTEFCFACRFNETIPNLSVEEHIPLWQKMEAAKRRALFTLKALPVPLNNLQEDPDTGLSFEFIVDRDAKDHFLSKLPHHPDVMTGHNFGNITINLAEADDVARSATKAAMGEQYRTLLGHFRHELGHYYFDQIIAPDPNKHTLCKTVFGDDECDYQQALDNHYQNGGPPADWPQNFISEYATMHPWEDWAETWAHYMHIIDTLETVQSNGVELSRSRMTHSDERIDDLNLPQQHDSSDFTGSFAEVLDTWMRFSVILNSINRSMGLQDAYPFVLTPPVRNKLTFIHHAIHDKLALLPQPV
ncbi:MAG TPA: putative zinc-binding metallopeptidase [Marinagarivorans sp.]